MLALLWLVPALPLAGFCLLVAAGRRMSARGTAVIGAGSVGASAVVAAIVCGTFIASPPNFRQWRQVLWTWMDVAGFRPEIAFYLDPLAVVMTLVVAFVGFLILLYSTQFMRGDDGYNRFFAYMDLFVASMLVLVLADNLLPLYLGWEGVGLCSFLLIGFWYKDEANARAARKAFIVTRIGDTAMIIGLFLLIAELGTLDIQELMRRASQQWASELLAGHPTAILAASLLLGGALGKSAQLPLQTWLPDAMAGPTPVSALIHAATMVTAGVYLIARTHVLFEMAPAVQTAVAVIGAATLLYAGCSALVQRDIKRVLAYSTISQIGYMFLALGVGAYSAAMFHFMTHAFFKSLLFLGAGAVILAMGHEHDMFKMGGLRRRMPVVFWTFLIGAASLSALPLVTAGFYSKDMILAAAMDSPIGSAWLWAAGLAGALLTSLYAFRMVFVTFFGPATREMEHKAGPAMIVPLVVLAALSIAGGFVELPRTLGDWPAFSNFVGASFSSDFRRLWEMAPRPSPGGEATMQLVAAGASVLGLVLAWVLYIRSPRKRKQFAARNATAAVGRFWFAGWGFDWLYERLFVRPFVWIANINRDDVVDSFYDGVAWTGRALNFAVSLAQNGRLRWYAAGIALAGVIAVAIVVLS
ncbi:MAG: NADH-quinone oxidoreductase subunit L [Phycisphaerae bacterium]